jgi:hypothetical protein
LVSLAALLSLSSATGLESVDFLFWALAVVVVSSGGDLGSAATAVGESSFCGLRTGELARKAVGDGIVIVSIWRATTVRGTSTLTHSPHLPFWSSKVVVRCVGDCGREEKAERAARRGLFIGEEDVGEVAGVR